VWGQIAAPSGTRPINKDELPAILNELPTKLRPARGSIWTTIR